MKKCLFEDDLSVEHKTCCVSEEFPICCECMSLERESRLMKLAEDSEKSKTDLTTRLAQIEKYFAEIKSRQAIREAEAGELEGVIGRLFKVIETKRSELGSDIFTADDFSYIVGSPILSKEVHKS
jgi:hypothetical protein